MISLISRQDVGSHQPRGEKSITIIALSCGREGRGKGGCIDGFFFFKKKKEENEWAGWWEEAEDHWRCWEEVNEGGRGREDKKHR